MPLVRKFYKKITCCKKRGRGKWSLPREIMLFFLQSSFPWEKHRELDLPSCGRRPRGWNTPALTEIPSSFSSAWRLYSCAFLRDWTNLLGQSSRSQLSCFPPKNFHIKCVNDRTWKSAALEACYKQEIQCAQKKMPEYKTFPLIHWIWELFLRQERDGYCVDCEQWVYILNFETSCWFTSIVK